MSVAEFVKNPTLFVFLALLVFGVMGYFFYVLRETMKENKIQAKEFREDNRNQTERFLEVTQQQNEKLADIAERNITVNTKLANTIDLWNERISSQLQRIEVAQQQGFADLREDVGKVQNTLSQIQWTQGGNRND